MSQTFKGDVTNNVVELNLQAEATNIGSSSYGLGGTNDGEIRVVHNGDIVQSDGFYDAGSSLAGNDMKGLVIGTSCTSIGNNAFYFCTGLTGSLTIPDSVASIGSGAFDSCSGLNGTLYISRNANLTFLQNRMFNGCSSLIGAIEIPSNITSIGNNAFNGCSSFSSLIWNNNITSIGEFAFRNCNGLTVSLAIPDSVTSIEEWCF